MLGDAILKADAILTHVAMVKVRVLLMVDYFETERRGKLSNVLPCCYAFYNQTNRNSPFFSFSF